MYNIKKGGVSFANMKKGIQKIKNEAQNFKNEAQVYTSLLKAVPEGAAAFNQGMVNALHPPQKRVTQQHQKPVTQQSQKPVIQQPQKPVTQQPQNPVTQQSQNKLYPNSHTQNWKNDCPQHLGINYLNNLRETTRSRINNHSGNTAYQKWSNFIKNNEIDNCTKNGLDLVLESYKFNNVNPFDKNNKKEFEKIKNNLKKLYTEKNIIFKSTINSDVSQRQQSSHRKSNTNITSDPYVKDVMRNYQYGLIRKGLGFGGKRKSKKIKKNKLTKKQKTKKSRKIK